jgi:hypothetical protein
VSPSRLSPLIDLIGRLNKADCIEHRLVNRNHLLQIRNALVIFLLLSFDLFFCAMRQMSEVLQLRRCECRLPVYLQTIVAGAYPVNCAQPIPFLIFFAGGLSSWFSWANASF